MRWKVVTVDLLMVAMLGAYVAEWLPESVDFERVIFAVVMMSSIKISWLCDIVLKSKEPKE